MPPGLTRVGVSWVTAPIDTDAHAVRWSYVAYSGSAGVWVPFL